MLTRSLRKRLLGRRSGPVAVRGRRGHLLTALCLIGLLGALTGCQGATTQTGAAMVPTPEEAQRLDASLADAAVGSEQHRDFIAAAAYYRALYNREPDNVPAIVGLSRSLRRLGKPVEAQAIVRRGLAKPPPAAKPAAPEGAPTPPALPLGEVTAEPVAPPATPAAVLRHHADEFQVTSPATAAADPVTAKPSVDGDAPAMAPDGVPSSAPETSG